MFKFKTFKSNFSNFLADSRFVNFWKRAPKILAILHYSAVVFFFLETCPDFDRNSRKIFPTRNSALPEICDRVYPNYFVGNFSNQAWCNRVWGAIWPSSGAIVKICSSYFPSPTIQQIIIFGFFSIGGTSGGNRPQILGGLLPYFTHFFTKKSVYFEKYKKCMLYEIVWGGLGPPSPPISASGSFTFIPSNASFTVHS